MKEFLIKNLLKIGEFIKDIFMNPSYTEKTVEFIKNNRVVNNKFINFTKKITTKITDAIHDYVFSRHFVALLSAVAAMCLVGPIIFEYVHKVQLTYHKAQIIETFIKSKLATWEMQLHKDTSAFPHFIQNQTQKYTHTPENAAIFNLLLNFFCTYDGVLLALDNNGKVILNETIIHNPVIRDALMQKIINANGDTQLSILRNQHRLDEYLKIFVNELRMDKKFSKFMSTKIEILKYYTNPFSPFNNPNFSMTDNKAICFMISTLLVGGAVYIGVKYGIDIMNEMENIRPKQ